METTMNMSSEKIKAEVIAKLKSVFGELIPKNKVATVRKYIDAYIKNKANSYYNTDIPFKSIVESLSKATADSKAELIFYELLTENKVPFKFQYKISPYRVDFLIQNWLVFELDRPGHRHTKAYDDRRDKYIEKLGYEVMRMPLSILVMSPELVIDEIKDRMK